MASRRSTYLLALPSPYYTFGGLSSDNLASSASHLGLSSPKQAGLELLSLCLTLHQLGQQVLLFPPHERPYLPLLRQMGFAGSDKEVVGQCAREAPLLLPQLCSSSAIWMANSAICTSSVDAIDHKVHLSVANKGSRFHRSIEASFSLSLFRLLLRHEESFVCHPPLPMGGQLFGDEGSANLVRLCRHPEGAGIYLFGYGRSSLGVNSSLPSKWMARQTLEASQAIARRHLLPPSCCYFAQQLPRSIDSGVFHLDLVVMYEKDWLLVHQEAFLAIEPLLDELKALFEQKLLAPLKISLVSAAKVPLAQTLASYVFNSLPVPVGEEGAIVLLAPQQCQVQPAPHRLLAELLQDASTPLSNVVYLELGQSMANGGGPACLVLRLPLTSREQELVHPNFVFNEMRYRSLKRIVERYYRDALKLDQLNDPQLVSESHEALDELSQLFRLTSLYSFQKA